VLTLPDLSLAEQLWPGAAGIALMSFTETVAAGRAFAASGEPSPQPNRELMATGLANGFGALLGAMPAGGGTSQTAVNRLAGARSQLSGVVTAGAALLTMLLLAPLVGLLPQATLAAVVIVYSIGLIQPADFREILSVRRTEFIWAVTALVGVMLLGTLRGIVVAIIVSLGAIAHHMADPAVRELCRKRGSKVFQARSGAADDETFPGLLMLRPEGRIFFANAGRVGERMRAFFAEANPRVVAIDLSGVTDLEYTALKMLIEAEERLREDGIEVWLVGMNPDVRSVVERSALGAELRPGRIFLGLEPALAHYLASPPR